MGGGGQTYHIVDEKFTAKSSATFTRLINHPNFSEPATPNELTIASIVGYTLEYAASLISPPKIDDEDDNFSCDSLASTLRVNLKREIIKTLMQQAESNNYKYNGILLNMDLQGFWYFIFKRKLYNGYTNSIDAENVIDELLGIK